MELESVSASGEVNGYNNSESVSNSGARTQQTPSQTPSQTRTSTDGVSNNDNMDRKSSPVESNMFTYESIEKELQQNIGLLMSPPAVVHHVDYRSKAEERKAELEALRRKSLAKPQGTISMLSTLNFVSLQRIFVLPLKLECSGPIAKSRGTERICRLPREATRNVSKPTTKSKRCDSVPT
jgi:hypothetical protein